MNYQTIKNPIFKIEWAGWESDTLRLQNNGWEISVEQDVAYRRMRFAIRNDRFRIYGVSTMIDELDYMDMTNRHYYTEFPTVRVQHMASKFEVIIQADFSKFEPIDATPMFSTQERKSLEDFKIFRPLNKVQEIVIARPNVTQLLDEIIKHQDPKQSEIREKRRRELRDFNRMTAGRSFEEIAEPENELVCQVVAVR